MSPNDERHGENAGYVAGCREACCRKAKSRYDKARRWELHSTGQYRKVPAYRAARRIQALQALGWSVPQIGKVCGINHRHLYYLTNYATVYTSTLTAITAAYNALSMVIPPADTTSRRISTVRARNHAARMGWPPPLAWDDIDNEAEVPSLAADSPRYQPSDELIEEWDHLRRAGVDLTEAARRLGISRDGLQKAIERAGEAGGMSEHLFTLPSDAFAVTSDDCYTPRWVFDAMGLEFDLDVAAPPGGPWHVPAKRYYTAEDDGLTAPWDGLVFANPPYSDYTPWAERWALHPRGVLMGYQLPNAAWTRIAFNAADCVTFTDTHFIDPNGRKVRLRQPVFFAFRGVGTEPAERLAAADRCGVVLYGRKAA